MSEQLITSASSEYTLSRLAASMLPNLIFLLVLFPNINFFPFLATNNQPVAFLLIAAWWVSKTNGKIPLNGFTLFFCFLVLFSALYGVLTLLLADNGHVFAAHATGFANYSTSAFDVAMTFVSYMVGPCILLYLLYNFHRIDTSVIRFFIIFQFVVCIVQMFGSASMQGVLNSLFESVFIGFLQESHEFGRGVAGTFPEPSHLGRYLPVMLGLLFVYRGCDRISRRQFAGYMALVAALTMLNQSLSALAIFLMWLLLQFFRATFTGYLLRSVKVMVIVALIGTSIALLPDTTRLGEAREKAGEFVEVASDLRPLDLQIVGGIRLVNMVVGYSSISLFPFGQGLGSYIHNLPETAALLGINIQDTGFYKNVVTEVGAENVITKPNGFGAQLAYDFGYLGLIPMLILAAAVFRQAFFSPIFNKAIWGLPIIGLVLALFYTTTTFPVPWILLAFVAFYAKLPATKQKVEFSANQSQSDLTHKTDNT